jgi:AraC-like DNA-binding protein
MPIYMDIHDVPGIEAIDAAEAHRKDMLIQEKYQCKCMTYWVDVTRGVAFCLIEAPEKSIVEEIHRNSHGLIPNKIIEVKNELVESFLGRIHDPENAAIADNGLKVFSESALRILLVTDMIDPVLLRYELGMEKANDLLSKQNGIIRKESSNFDGREVEHGGNGFIVSFSSAVKAVSCALEIRKSLSDSDRSISGFKIGINAGEPVAKSDKLFGDTIQLARYLCSINSNDRIVVSSGVKELLARDYFQKTQNNFMTILPQDEMLVETLFNTLEENWQNSDFDVAEFGQAMAMSKSRLYRKTTELWGLAPNLLLREFRLDKARELLKRQSFNISQTTFDSGFTSPSYFTKCFKKRFGLLPAMYLEALS